MMNCQDPSIFGRLNAAGARPMGSVPRYHSTRPPLVAGGLPASARPALHPRRHFLHTQNINLNESLQSRCSHQRRAVLRSASSGTPSAVLVVSSDEETAAITMAAVATALAVRCVGLVHTRPGLNLTRDSEMLLSRGSREDTWELDGTMADAVTCGLEPVQGLMASLGLSPSLCVVGAAREPSLGEDMHASIAVSSARRAAVIGVPTVALCLPTRSESVPLEPSAQALAQLLGGVATSLCPPYTSGLPTASNCPRAHFPFPTEGRWSGLGGPQLPVDDELRQSLQAGSSRDFAAADCWSLGEMILPPESTAVGSSPPELRGILRRAFRDADTFLCLHVPPRWSPQAHKPFSSTRPGVLWHQENVTAGSSGAVSRGPDGTPDLWGRSLPVQTVGSRQPTTEGATFVSQLNTEKVISDGQGVRPTGPYVTAPRSFSIGKGTTLMDSSAKGDVDSIMSGSVAVTTLQTWPYGHAFSLLDPVMVEALREDSSGLPLWLTAK